MKKAIVPLSFAACCVPLAWLAQGFLRNDLGPNPVDTLLNQLGYFAFVLLVLTLACTPAQILFKLNWPVRIRKLLGDFSFFYACLHLLTWTVLDQGMNVHDILREIVKRKFILLGISTFLLLLPLAITSTQGWQKRLGFRRWKRLHRVVYLAGVLAGFHFLLRFKTVRIETVAWGSVVLFLLGVRLVNQLRTRPGA